MTHHLPYDQYPKSARLLFDARKSAAQDKETENSNASLLKRQKAIRMVKDSKTYLTERDVF